MNSGANTLTLSADSDAYLVPSDGIGSLTIASAPVTSANASTSSITLSGANIGIDTSSTPATIQQQMPPGATYGAAYPRTRADIRLKWQCVRGEFREQHRK